MSIYIRKDHWTATEEQVVKAAVMKYGTNQWSRVASLLARKSPVQCKARWYEHLSPHLLQSAWSAQEDKQLLILEKAMPNMWRSIAATLGGRTATQCFERWTKLTDANNAESTRQILTEADIDDSEESEPNSDSERQMMAEAKARLSNNLGKKANRKQRERLDDEAAFQKSIAEHRATGSAIKVKQSKFAIDYNQGIPYETLPPTAEQDHIPAHPKIRSKQVKGTLQKQAHNRVPRKPRQKLVLPEPVLRSQTTDPPLTSLLNRTLAREKLQDLPVPCTENTLITLALITSENEDFDTGSVDLEHKESEETPILSLEEALRDEDSSCTISVEARRLLENEVAQVQQLHTYETTKATDSRTIGSLSALNSKYEMLHQRLANAAKARQVQLSL